LLLAATKHVILGVVQQSQHLQAAPILRLSLENHQSFSWMTVRNSTPPIPAITVTRSTVARTRQFG
jgi:hypothetical protein